MKNTTYKECCSLLFSSVFVVPVLFNVDEGLPFFRPLNVRLLPRLNDKLQKCADHNSRKACDEGHLGECWKHIVGLVKRVLVCSAYLHRQRLGVILFAHIHANIVEIVVLVWLGLNISKHLPIAGAAPELSYGASVFVHVD